MQRVIRAAFVLSVVVVLFQAGAARSAPDAAAVNRVAFTDARGEGVGIDISRVVVSSTNDGELVFRVDMPTHAALTDDMRIQIWIDTDLDRRTGHEGGEYFLLADDEGSALYACQNPPACDVFAPPSSDAVRFSYGGGGATFTVDPRFLERPKRFRFSVSAIDGIASGPNGYDYTNAHYDFAPRKGQWWTFDTRALIVKALSASPNVPRAGHAFTLRMAAIRTATGAALATGKVSCSLRIGVKTIRPRSSGFVGGRAVCAYDVPVGSSGRPYTTKITARDGANAVARSLSGYVG